MDEALTKAIDKYKMALDHEFDQEQTQEAAERESIHRFRVVKRSGWFAKP
jgi:hypothetical protein